MRRLPGPPVLLVTDRTQARLPLADVAAAAIDGGCRWISIREKDLSPDEQVELVRRVRAKATHAGAVVTLHGEAELAARAEADGVHLPANADPEEARRRLGPQALVGLSIHAASDLDALSSAARGALDYVIAGPAYPTASKPGYTGPFQSEGFRAVTRGSIPVIAIGGIEPENIAPLVAQGVRGIAVMGGIMRAADARAAMRACIDAWRIATTVVARSTAV